MTIICFKDGIMAADGLELRNSVVVDLKSRKIVRARDGSLAAASGDSSFIERFDNWVKGAFTTSPEGVAMDGFLNPLLDAPEGDFSGMVVRPDGSAFHVNHKGRLFTLTEKFWAIGSAWELAHGAMLYGASAEEAVRLCCANHVYCGGEVQVELLNCFTEASVEEEPSVHTGRSFLLDRGLV